MKFQELNFLVEQMYEPNMGVPTVPGVDPYKDIEFQGAANVGQIVNSLVNPIQVAIDSYNLGTKISDAYSQYQSAPSSETALSFLAMLGMGLVALKGGVGGKTAERVTKAKIAADQIRAQSKEAGKMAAATYYMKEMIKLFKDPKNVDELAAAQGMTSKELDSMLKATIPEVKSTTQGAEEAIKQSPKLKFAYEIALKNIDDVSKEVPVTPPPAPAAVAPVPTPAPVAPTNSGVAKIVPKPPATGPYRSKQIPPTPGVKKQPSATAMPSPTPVRTPADLINNLQDTFGIKLDNKQAVNVLKAIGTNPQKRMDFIKKVWSYTPSGMVVNFLKNHPTGRLITQTIPGVLYGGGIAAAVGTAGGLASQQAKAQERQNKVQKLQQAGFTPEQIKRMFPGSQ